MMKRRIAFLSTVVLAHFLVSGCAPLTELGQKVWGSSIAHLERARAEGRSITVAMPLAACFEKCRRIIEAMKAQIYLEDPKKRYLAAMKFEGHVDTTQVGIFLTAVDAVSTKVEVSSLSPGLASFVAQVLFPELGEKDVTAGAELKV